MDDFDNLNSKTDSDLRQIAVAFGDFTPEEAESKTRDELIMAITGAKDIGDVTVVNLAEEPVQVKPVPIPETMTSNENNKSLDELIVDVGRNARFETNELADAMLKAEREEEKKVAKKEVILEETASEKIEVSEAVTEEKTAEKKAAKRTAKKPARTTKKAKAEEPAPVNTEEAAPENAEEAAAEPASVDPGKKEKKPAAKAKKPRNTKKKADAADDAPADEATKSVEPTPVEALISEAENAAEITSEIPDENNILDLIEGYDLVIDCSDNYKARYLINDACAFANVPLVFGAVYQFEGQVGIFNLDGGPCYRCQFPAPPEPGLVPTCAEGGAISPLPGIIGSIQANEALKLILGIGEHLDGKILTIDSLYLTSKILKIKKNHTCPICSPSRWIFR